MNIKQLRRRVVGGMILPQILLVGITLVPVPAQAQGPSQSPATQPNLKDDRLAFLTVQLSSIEESLKAVDLAIKRTGYKVQLNQEKAKQYEKGNELMDRKGGGPMPWDQFYGRTADKFFYHPTDPNTKYRFGNNNPGGKAPVPAPQRPPQLDYFYQANQNQADQAAAEIAKLGNDVNRLLQRRRQLELEQSAMWATIAMEAVDDLSLSLRPLYRFQLRSTAAGTSDPLTGQRIAVVRALALFVRTVGQTAEQLHESVMHDQPGGYDAYQKGVLAAYQLLQRDVLAVATGLTDDSKRIDSLLTQAKRLKSLSTNAGEAFQIQGAADEAGDEPRHRTARGQLQESVLNTAEVVLQLHQDVTKLAGDWGIEGESGKESPDVLPQPTARQTPNDAQKGSAATTPPPAQGQAPTNRSTTGSAAAGKSSQTNPAIDLLKQIDLKKDVKTGNWEQGKDGLSCRGSGKLQLPYSPGEEYDFHIEFTRLEGEGDVVQQLSQGDHRFAWLMGYWKNTACGFGRIGGKSANQNVTTVLAKPALTNDRRYSCVVQVRRKSISALIDGKLVAHYDTDFSDMSEQPAWAINSALGIGCNSSTVFHTIEVIPVTGEGKLIRMSAGR